MSAPVEDRSLYRSRAELYDLIYHLKDYAAEAARLRELLESEGVAAGAWINEAACGTGKYLDRLRKWYRVSGFDVHDEMLDIARARLPGVPLFRADMTDFTLDEPADALLCLFSSLAYLHTEEQLAAAARSFHRALRHGGALLIEPFVAPDDFEDGRPHLDTYEDDDLKLTRSIVTRSEGRLAVLDFHWLVARRGEPVEHFVERHELKLWARDELERAFGDAGFEVRFEERGLIEGRDLMVCRRR
jgi:daunosaminyl-N,N-dimethyltransferase/N-dimethyltransferase